MSLEILLEAEKALFKCICLNNRLLYEVERAWFIDIESQFIYDTLKNLIENKKEINQNNFLLVSNNSQITTLFAEEILPYECNESDFDLYLKRIKEEFIKKDINEIIKNDLNILTSTRGELKTDKLEEFSSHLRNDLDLLHKENKLKSFRDIGLEYRDVLFDRLDGKRYSYGDSFMDSISEGAVPGQITTIFGATGTGKSAFAINIFNKCINKQIPIMYVTLEMDRITTVDRLMALRTRIPMNEFLMKKENEFNNDLIKIFEKEYEKLLQYENKFFILDWPGIKLKQLESEIIKAKQKMNVDYMIVIIDLWTMLGDVSAEAREIEKAINLTNDLVKRQNIHLIALVQANRSATDKKILTPRDIENLKIRNIDKIKNSAAIAERSRCVFVVERPKHWYQIYFPESEETEVMDDTIELTLLKNSNGQIGQTIKYLWNSDCFLAIPMIEEE